MEKVEEVEVEEVEVEEATLEADPNIVDDRDIFNGQDVLQGKYLSIKATKSGKLIAINSPTEIEVELLQKIPPHFSLGQSIRVLGENTELFKITKQETQNKFSISKPLNKKIISGINIFAFFIASFPFEAAFTL